MTTAIAVVTQNGENPGSLTQADVYGYALCGMVSGTPSGKIYGVYLISGTDAQITDLDRQPGVISYDVDSWQDVMSQSTRARLNALLIQAGWPLIPEGSTYEQAMQSVFGQGWSYANYYIIDPYAPVCP